MEPTLSHYHAFHSCLHNESVWPKKVFSKVEGIYHITLFGSNFEIPVDDATSKSVCRMESDSE